jgi:hypothetical protein
LEVEWIDVAREGDGGTFDGARAGTKIREGEKGGVGAVERAAVGKVARQDCGRGIVSVTEQGAAEASAERIRDRDRRSASGCTAKRLSAKKQQLTENGSGGAGVRGGQGRRRCGLQL